MSKLAALLVKLQARAEARRRAEDDDARSSSSAASPSAASSDSGEQEGREQGSADASVYGSRAYWDARYEIGEIGAASGKKGELSNEWCVAREPFLSLLSLRAPGSARTGGLVVMTCTKGAVAPTPMQRLSVRFQRLRRPEEGFLRHRVGTDKSPRGICLKPLNHGWRTVGFHLPRRLRRERTMVMRAVVPTTVEEEDGPLCGGWGAVSNDA